MLCKAVVYSLGMQPWVDKFPHSKPRLPSCSPGKSISRPALGPPCPVPLTNMNSLPHGSRASIDILEELQLIAAQNLEKLDINKYYEIIRELGKGTYGKVDLVIHKIRGINCGCYCKEQKIVLISTEQTKINNWLMQVYHISNKTNIKSWWP